MPHLRYRTLEADIKKDLSWAPVVSVLGMRQVGKTTLLKRLGQSYLTLDDDVELQRLERGDWTRVEQARSPFVIDEAQKSPGLFDRVKLIVDRKNNRPGQFVLTGSVRFLSRKQIRESLTGRTSLLELLPLTLAECHSQSIHDFFKLVSNRTNDLELFDSLAERNHFSKSGVIAYLKNGGMPGICFKRDSKIQARMREAHIETLLMRDLQFLIKTTVPFAKLKAILTNLSLSHAQDLSLSALARQVQLSVPTVKQIMQAYEDLFIIRKLGSEWYFSDLGIGTYLGAEKIQNPLFHMERFIYQEIYSQLTYLYRAQFTLTSYKTRGGIRIPFVVDLAGSKTQRIAIAVDPTEGGSEKSLKGLTWLNKSLSKPALGIVLHQGSKAYTASTGALCIPYHWIA